MTTHHSLDKHTGLARKKRIVFWPRRIQPQITTLIIGSKSLMSDTCGSVTLVPYGTATEQSLGQSAAHALQGAPQTTYRQLLAQFPHISQQPAALYDSALTGTAWHQGDHYTLYWFGSPEQIIQRSDLTDNEREQLLAKARSMAVTGKIVYAVGRTTHPHTSTVNLATVQPTGLHIEGLLTHEVQLQPRVKEALNFCAKHDIQIVYSSRDPMLATTAIATKAKLLTKEQLPLRILHTMQPTKAAVYALVTDRVRQQIAKLYASESTLITDEPLPEIVRTITVA